MGQPPLHLRLLLVQQGREPLRVPPVQIRLDVQQGHPQLLQGGDDHEHVVLLLAVIAVAVLPPEGGGKQADLVVVVQGALVGPADAGKVGRPQAGDVLFLRHGKIPP